MRTHSPCESIARRRELAGLAGLMSFALFLRLQGRLERPQSSLHEPADRLAAGHGRTQRLLPHRAQLATHFGNTFHDVILSSKKRGHLVAPAHLLYVSPSLAGELFLPGSRPAFFSSQGCSERSDSMYQRYTILFTIFYQKMFDFFYWL